MDELDPVSTMIHRHKLFCFVTDRLVLHDQPLPGSHCHAVFRDQEARNGTDASGTGPLPVDVDAGQHVGVRITVVLSTNHQVHRPFVAPQQAASVASLPGLSQSPAAEQGSQVADAAYPQEKTPVPTPTSPPSPPPPSKPPPSQQHLSVTAAADDDKNQ